MISSLCETEHTIRERKLASFDWKKREKRRGKMELKQMLREGRQPGEDALLAEEKDL